MTENTLVIVEKPEIVASSVAPTDPPRKEYPPEPPGFFRIIPRIGRNKPCPCGSGRKFKRCHGG